MLRIKIAVFLALLAVQAGLLIGLNWQTLVNRTEVGHLGAAAYFWKTGRFDVFHVNPPLTRMIVGPAIRLCNPEYDWGSYSPRPQDRTEWSLGSAFIHANSPEKIRVCVFAARCSLIPLILVGSVFGFRFASELYGYGAGFAFLVLWTFSPLVLGWGATICPDVVAASLGIVALYYLWHWLKTPMWKNAIISGILLGLLPLAKMTWIIAVPIFFLLWTIWRFPQIKQFSVILLIGIYVINMGYGFDGLGKKLKDYTFLSSTLTGNAVENRVQPGNRFENSPLGKIPVPFPAEFVQGFDTQKRDFEHGLESYFCGEISQHGWWNYYLVTLAIKEPLGVWGLFLLAVCVSCFDKRYRSVGKNELVLLLPMLVILLVVSSQTGFSLHPRYIVLMLPLLYIWVGKVFLAKNVVSVLGAVLVSWVVVASLWYYPHSLSYFNESIGGPKNGPKYLLGSNVDWGQNMYFLKTWYEKHPETRPIHFAYNGGETLSRLGLDDLLKFENPPLPGWYAIGVNELYGAKEYESFKNLEPVDRIGWGILIYHLPETR